ncbi:murein hydrolase activator EnvC family protein [Candidatus Margulisiibacteriota bacterium]
MKKLLFGLLILVTFSNLLFAASAQNIEKKLAKTKEKIKLNKTKLKTQKRKEKKVLKVLVNIERDLYYTANKLNRAENSLNLYLSQIKDKEKEVNLLEKQFAYKKKILTKRMVQIYKNKKLGILEFIFSQKDLGFIMDYSYIIGKILNTDLKLVEEVKLSFKKVKAENKLLNQKKLTAAKLKESIIKKRLTLIQKQKQKKSTLSYLQRQISRYEKQNNVLLEDSRKMTSLIKKLKKKAVYIGTGKFIKPVLGWLSSKYGFRIHPIFRRRIFHTGLDIAAPRGSKVKAADTGTVIFVGKWGGYGNVTIIDHGKNISTVYAHLSRIIVKKGYKIKKGSVLGYVGTTGLSTGPHLHFEVRVNGKPVNPKKYVAI